MTSIRPCDVAVIVNADDKLAAAALANAAFSVIVNALDIADAPPTFNKGGVSACVKF